MSLIYVPSGRALEYAKLALNVYSGCGTGEGEEGGVCKYCYAPGALHKTRETFSRPKPRPDFIRNLTKEVAKLQPTSERVLLSFSCDPYQTLDGEYQHTRQAIQILHAAGIPVQVLTKGGSRALRDFDLFTPADAFASTLTFSDDADSHEWEPWAALPADRMNTLKVFHEAGIPTWASLEPVIDPAQTLEIIDLTHPYVDLFKIGKLNHHPLAQEIDWGLFGHQAKIKLDALGKAYVFKDDLRRYLSVNLAAQLRPGAGLPI